MNTANYMLDIITRFRVILDAHTKHSKCFDQYAIQVEYWLKGELLPFFDSEKNTGKLVDFNTEVPCGDENKRVDYRLILPYGEVAPKVWIELKHWQIGYQGNQQWVASDYFSSISSWGICGDVEKLSKIIDGDKYILILATKNPEYEERGDWLKGIDKFNQKFTH
jgi:hypothetical protein